MNVLLVKSRKTTKYGRGSHSFLWGVTSLLGENDWGVTSTQDRMMGSHFRLGQDDWGVIDAYDTGSKLNLTAVNKR